MKGVDDETELSVTLMFYFLQVKMLTLVEVFNIIKYAIVMNQKLPIKVF